MSPAPLSLDTGSPKPGKIGKMSKATVRSHSKPLRLSGVFRRCPKQKDLSLQSFASRLLSGPPKQGVEYNDSMLPLYVVGYHTEDNEFFSERTWSNLFCNSFVVVCVFANRKWSIRAGPADVPLTVELTMRVIASIESDCCHSRAMSCLLTALIQVR
eukprot:2480657-Amphidinium_carterae.1